VPLGAALAAGGAAAGSAAGLALAPWLAALAVTAGGVLLFLGSVALLAAQFYLPTGWALAALVAGASIAYVVRFLAEDRRRRRVQAAFSHYLSPHVVDRLVDETTALRLGGAARDVTIMFADLSGFTALSERVGPEALVAETNRYLKLIVDEVEASGGYVDKFIGDAVMAMWGAPVDDPRHATNAVKAALRAEARIAEEGRAAAAEGRPVFAVKIGINSGPAVVGNVGTERRFNYTAVGETVNVASRLEGVVGVYRAGIVVGEATRERVGDTVLFCELDRLTVKGKTRPLAIFRPLAEAADGAPFAAGYEAALAAYRGRRFEEAAQRWRALGAAGGPAAVMAERAAAFAADPPPADWAGAWILTSK
jgi:class 3 adenylate cyclase